MIRAAITLKLTNLRGDRRRHRRAHDLDSGSARHRPPLGLSLLLAARRLFRRAGAQPHRRDAHHGGFRLLHSHHRVRVGRTDCGRSIRVVPTDPMDEQFAPKLKGYRGDGPVRIGNEAASQSQHDIYGSIILAATPMFFDRRLPRPGDEAICSVGSSRSARSRPRWRSSRMPACGSIAAASSFTPIRPRCAGPAASGSPRSRRISALPIAPPTGMRWRDRLHEPIVSQAWNPRRKAFTAAFGSDDLDASTLLLPELGIVDSVDPRFVSTVDAIQRELVRYRPCDALFERR